MDLLGSCGDLRQIVSGEEVVVNCQQEEVFVVVQFLFLVFEVDHIETVPEIDQDEQTENDTQRETDDFVGSHIVCGVEDSDGDEKGEILQSEVEGIRDGVADLHLEEVGVGQTRLAQQHLQQSDDHHQEQEKTPSGRNSDKFVVGSFLVSPNRRSQIPFDDLPAFLPSSPSSHI